MNIKYIKKIKAPNAVFQDFSEEYATEDNPKEQYSYYKYGEHYTCIIRKNTELYLFYCEDNETMYYVDKQAVIRMWCKEDSKHYILKPIQHNKISKAYIRKAIKNIEEIVNDENN